MQQVSLLASLPARSSCTCCIADSCRCWRPRHAQVCGAKVPAAQALHLQPRLLHYALDVAVPPAAPLAEMLPCSRHAQGVGCG